MLVWYLYFGQREAIMENSGQFNICRDVDLATRQEDEARTNRLLVRYSSQNDAASRKAIVDQFRPLVEKLARHYIPTGIPLDDLMQEGFIGLLHAIERFDASKNIKFITYASHCIDGRLRHFLRDRGQIIKEPARLQQLGSRLRRATETLMNNLGRQPSTAEIAPIMGITEELVCKIEATHMQFSVASLDEGFDDGSLTLADSGAVSAQSGLTGNSQHSAFELPIEDKVVLEAALTRLKDLEQNVVFQYYYEDRSQTEIARDLGISNNYVSHILKNTARKLQQMYRSEAVRETALQNGSHHLRMVTTQAPFKARAAANHLTIIDTTTGLYSRDYFDARLEEEISRAVRHDLKLSVVRVKLEGDPPDNQLFTMVGQTIKNSVRKMDIVACTANDEIGALLPQTGDSGSAMLERLGQRLELLEAELPRRFSYTVGSASFPELRNRSELFEAAAPAG